MILWLILILGLTQASFVNYPLNYGPTNHTFDTVHINDEINLFIHDMAEHEDVTLTSMGQTYEGRDIYALTIAASGDDADVNYQVVECGIHAREWLSPAFCQMFVYELLYGNYQHLREKARWIVIPNFNPDGYTYTFTFDPSTQLEDNGITCIHESNNTQTGSINPCNWKKNRASVWADGTTDNRYFNLTNTLTGYPETYNNDLGIGAECTGVDLLMNHDSFFDETRANLTEIEACTHDHAGNTTEDQLETQAKVNFLADKWNAIDMYFEIQAGADCLFTPSLGDYNDQAEMEELMMNMIEYVKRHPLDVTQDVTDNVETIEAQLKASSEYHASLSNPGFNIRVLEWESTVCPALRGPNGNPMDWAKLQGAQYSYSIDLPGFEHYQPPPHLMVPWISQYLRAIELSYKLIVDGATFEQMVQGLPELSEDDDTTDTADDITTTDTETQEGNNLIVMIVLFGFAAVGFIAVWHKATKEE